MASPSDIATAFTGAYIGAFAAGNAAGVASFYGADSVASYDGNLQSGAAAIAAAFVQPRLAGGPVSIKFSTTDAQFTPTGQLLIVCTGESSRPAGRFTQAFLLTSIPGGGMYVRAEVCRYGAGSVQSNTAADTTGMGLGFVGQYYQLYSANRAGLMALYRPTSQLIFETRGGTPLATGDAIGKRLGEEMPQGSHAMTSVDTIKVSDSPPAVLALVTGTITLGGETNGLPFAQTFLLIAEPTGAYCSNDVLRFNTG